MGSLLRLLKLPTFTAEPNPSNQRGAACQSSQWLPSAMRAHGTVGDRCRPHPICCEDGRASDVEVAQLAALLVPRIRRVASRRRQRVVGEEPGRAPPRDRLHIRGPRVLPRQALRARAVRPRGGRLAHPHGCCPRRGACSQHPQSAPHRTEHNEVVSDGLEAPRVAAPGAFGEVARQGLDLRLEQGGLPLRHLLRRRLDDVLRLPGVVVVLYGAEHIELLRVLGPALQLATIAEDVRQHRHATDIDPTALRQPTA
mmetsp:Transcript_60810/g.170429  ORF Transcript_60810/g.170429 Transcript_60810/m.170429 type:complete len:255 (+) Transcript_60810:682-1446(+)